MMMITMVIPDVFRFGLYFRLCLALPRQMHSMKAGKKNGKNTLAAMTMLLQGLSDGEEASGGNSAPCVRPPTIVRRGLAALNRGTQRYSEYETC